MTLDVVHSDGDGHDPVEDTLWNILTAAIGVPIANGRMGCEQAHVADKE